MNALLSCLFLGDVDVEDARAIGADDLAGLAEEQDPVGRRHVELQPLRTVLHQLGEQLQHRRRHLCGACTVQDSLKKDFTLFIQGDPSSWVEVICNITSSCLGIR